MKAKTKLFAVLILIIIPSSLALIEPIHYKGINIKFYSDDISILECLDKLDEIPEDYFEGLTTISIYKKFHWHEGIYYENKILLYKGCEQEVIIHELAHHLQYINGEKWIYLLKHEGRFLDYYYQILTNTNEVIE